MFVVIEGTLPTKQVGTIKNHQNLLIQTDPYLYLCRRRKFLSRDRKRQDKLIQTFFYTGIHVR